MRPSLLSLPVLSTALILLLQVHQDTATIALTIGTVALTASQVTALAGFGVLAKLSGVAAGLLISRAASAGGRRQSSYRHYRGKRSAQLEEVELEATLDMLTQMEPEHCYKRIICATQTGE